MTHIFNVLLLPLAKCSLSSPILLLALHQPRFVLKPTEGVSITVRIMLRLYLTPVAPLDLRFVVDPFLVPVDEPEAIANVRRLGTSDDADSMT